MNIILQEFRKFDVEWKKLDIDYTLCDFCLRGIFRKGYFQRQGVGVRSYRIGWEWGVVVSGYEVFFWGGNVVKLDYYIF